MLRSFLSTFVEYTADVFPYFLLASLIGAILQSLGGARLVSGRLVNSRYAPLFTAGVGAVVPLCSCSMIPVARTINSFSRRSYAPVLSFLITAPVLSPLVILLTFGVFGLELTLLRVLYVLLFALTLSVAVHFLFPKREILPLIQGGFQEERGKFETFLRSFRDLFLSTGKYVLLGLLIASLIKVLVPEELIASFASHPLSYPLIALLSVPIYVCSGEEVPIARSLHELGLTHGQALTFMLASTGICVPTVVALLNFLPRRIVFLYGASWFLVSLLAGFLTDAFLN